MELSNQQSERADYLKKKRQRSQIQWDRVKLVLILVFAPFLLHDNKQRRATVGPPICLAQWTSKANKQNK